MEAQTRPQLRKAISGLGFFSLALGAMIGVGWITSLDTWLELGGPAGAIAAFITGGVLILLIGLCYAELTPMLPVTGGEVAYSYKVLGTGKSFLIGWFLAFGYVSVCAFEAVSIGVVCGYLFPQLEVIPLYEFMGQDIYLPHIALGLAGSLLIGWINLYGVSGAIKLQIALTVLLGLCLTAFVVGGFVNGEADNLIPLLPDSTTKGNWVGFLSVLVMTPFWFVGFDTIPQAAEESDSSEIVRRLGWYIVAAIGAAVVFYVAIILASSLATPWQTLKGTELPTAKAFEEAFQSSFAAKLVLLAGLLGLLTSWNGFFIAGTRVLFSLGRGCIISPKFGTVHPRYGTPTRPIVFCTGLTCVAVFLGKPALVAFINVGSFCICCAFFGVCISFLKLRKLYPDLPRPYKLPGGKIIAMIAAIGSFCLILIMIVPGSGVALAFPLEWSILGIVLTTAVGFWTTSQHIRGSISEEKRRELILDEVAIVPEGGEKGRDQALAEQ